MDDGVICWVCYNKLRHPAKYKTKEERTLAQSLRQREYYKDKTKHPMFGKHHTPSALLKISEASKRIVRRPKSLTMRLQLSAVKRGIKNPKISGENHYNWKGGIRSLREQIRACMEYRQWREVVFQRDNYTCQICGACNGNGKTVYLESHHIKAFEQILKENNIRTLDNAIQCKELWDIDNGKTLCKPCHDKTKWGRPKNHWEDTQCGGF